MAILDSLPSVEITVVVDGEDLHEYHDTHKNDGEDTVTSYIEATSGANFAIRIKFSKDTIYKGDRLDFGVTIDGEYVDGLSMTKGCLDEIILIEGMPVIQGHLKKMKFSELKTVAEEYSASSGNDERVKTLGSICVTVKHRNTTSFVPRIFAKPAETEKIFSEKDIKGEAMTHSYSFGDEIEVTEASVAVVTEPVPGLKDIAGTYLFHYRSQGPTDSQSCYSSLLTRSAALKKLLIIPRTPSPIPLEDRPEQELSREELAELLRKYKAKAVETALANKKIKRELENGRGDDSRAGKKARLSTASIHLELNDDDTFTQIDVVNKQKEMEVITMD
ncbi:hypothetical protein D6C98_02246 [Aureobasidium pullulans]|uniref:DUF7918 domain-containing protein n=1 Tax=Aureobasidium pullulans TaxID=5580 RepID=A0A4S9NYG2_AURPU|nr:hypothetical protein D6D20_03005 [Aureobasidium pullulans]THY60715.1 hypothetical protein D6C98_02246 [Aureobasidium pullulans]